MVTDWDPITEELVEGIALEFRKVWTTGTIVETLTAMRGAFPRETDEAGMHWVGVRRT
ncbi:hypothetical protein [Rhizobium sp. S96]|uniref:hypothetical protein n=1 Tax=Rhizobium sp. S96 TaxID=3055140 RepID=UPI0025AB479C|nr:hypothetical protein [Rhizobium sp. S96]MDM9622707.1 hypothetical protein [Rhizobium sp. S96]